MKDFLTNNSSDQPGNYWIGQFIDEQPQGEIFDKTEWPLHVTIAGIFTVRATLLDAQLQENLPNIKPFDAEMVGSDLFGSGDNLVPVHLIRPSSKLIDLYSLVVDSLEVAGAKFNQPTFLRDRFNPHITKHALFGTIAQGDIINFHRPTLVDQAPDGDKSKRRIVAHYPIGNLQN